MYFKEPKIDFIQIDLRESIVTESCGDGVTDGGHYCIDSAINTECGDPMAATNG